MNWVLIAVGIVVILAVNIRGMYHKDRMPKWYLRLSWTVMGIYFIGLGLHRLGMLRF